MTRAVLRCAVAYLLIWEDRGMVCAEIERPASIAGGFVLVEVSWLIAAWNACRSTPLGVADFRTLLAAREMAARRCLAPEGKAVNYAIPELARLLGVAQKRATVSLRRLQAAGLIQWSMSDIAFPEVGDQDLEQLHDTIGRGQGSVAIPRRTLRFLAGGIRPALIATTLGVLLRCLSRRQGGFEGRGRVKAAWIAHTFAVDQRRVKQARKELVALGWISPEADGQRAMNRWGRAYRIDLAWDLHSTDGPSLPPRPAAKRPASATPSVDREPLPEREKNQEPASGGPAGVEVSGQRTQSPGPSPTLAPPPFPASQLANITTADLTDTARLLELHGQAVAKGLVTNSEADQLRFVAAAEHAIAIGRANPAGLFAYLIRSRAWRYSTQADEDRARVRLRDHLHGQLAWVEGTRLEFTSSMPATPTVSSGLSADARIVKEIRASLIRAGVYRDPWPAFSARNLGWDRGRWDAAIVEIGGS